MSIIHLIFFFCLALGATAQHLELSIPQVNAAVAEALSKGANFTATQTPAASATNSTNGVKATAAHAKVEAVVEATVSDPSYWLADITHQGISAFGTSGYVVWRNVKDYGAVGDGVTDDTAAINSAISSGGRCAPGSCQSSTTLPAIVYFPAGTYVVSTPIIDYYYTQLIGNPNGRAVIQATAGFTGLAVIDADPYQSSGNQGYGSTNVFYRQIRNIIIDLTSIPADTPMNALHWPTAQATSLQNVQINLSQASGTQHVGVFIENGSAGFMSDVVVYGGLIAFNIGNQQYTLRNIEIYNSVTAIYQLWDWGFTYKSLTISNCSLGIDMSAVDSTGTAQEVGAMVIIDSTITDTPVGIKTAFDTAPSPATAGTLILENVVLDNVPIAIESASGATVLAGGSTTISAWGEGNKYVPTGPTKFEGTYSATPRPSVLLSGTKYYESSKPQYETYTTSQILSMRSAGAKGDGTTDDTAAIQAAITQAASAGQIAFFDAGTYKVTNTIYIPAGSKVVGEAYAVIMSSGTTFSNIASPAPVVQIGKSGESGTVQWTDMIVSTQGSQPGAVLIEWNLVAATGSGMWDVHTRIGGFAGSDLQVAQCPTTAAVSSACYGAYMSMHVTTGASGVYLENVWLWTADHDLDDASSTQISVYTGRGLLFESTTGTAWLYGTAVEHHSLYQYQFANTKNVVMGYIQTETPYYQPSPNAINSPYPTTSTLNDPDYSTICTLSGNCDALGLRILDSSDIFVYGAGLYSFFDSYSTTCSDAGGTENCQSEIFDIESSTSIYVYDLNTVGAQCMIYRDGTCLASYADNVNVYPDTIALFQSG